MAEQRRVAVILARHDASLTPPTLDECRALLLTGQDSVAGYWQQNTENWFAFAAFDFFGPVDIMLPPPPDARGTVWDRARDAATAAGANLSGYDTYVVLNFPGHVGGVGYDGGTNGIGPGHVAVLSANDNHTFFSHEFGHLLGFDHSYGIPNAGADWSDDGVTQLYPVYGDPYDIMSSASFGGAGPTMELPAAFPGFPGSAAAGPMLARAQLHFLKPMALEAAGKVRHVYEDGDSEVFPLHPAGDSGGADHAELVVFHPAGEDASARGRVYVEYRQPFDFLAGTRWDAGLAEDGDERDRRGVIVHVVKDIPDTTTPAVWYAGRVCFPTPDADVVVDTPLGTAVVTVSDEFMHQDPPAYVRVRVTRQTRARVSVTTETEDAVTVTSSEKRPIPGWEFAGTFTWERRETVRTARYVPVVAGLGGESPHDAATTVKVQWYLGNYMLTADTGVETVLPPGTPRPVNLHYEIDAQTRVLTLHNEPGDGAYSLLVQASASDPPTWFTPVTADSTYEVDGISEGWGQDYQDFMDFWERITNPIPIPDFRPPRPDDYRIGIDRLRRTYDRLRQSNPGAAARLRPMMIDQERVLIRQFQRHR
ncbi:MAG TPA: hypothetical protein VM529_11710 [Gemmata sp.]|nr:hypothetical protein [Gemmata sp.]